MSAGKLPRRYGRVRSHIGSQVVPERIRPRWGELQLLSNPLGRSRPCFAPHCGAGLAPAAGSFAAGGYLNPELSHSRPETRPEMVLAELILVQIRPPGTEYSQPSGRTFLRARCVIREAHVHVIEIGHQFVSHSTHLLKALPDRFEAIRSHFQHVRMPRTLVPTHAAP